ncbi:glycosyltransferase [Erythrobacter sp. NE805]|uniref:glycosyltransferase n=1 Tax=Erythrobacter sp. NE805 TaxID=3389875 RepID=UPI00396B3B10
MSGAPRAIIVSRQRLIGATNGSSAYLIDIARSLAEAGLAPVLLQPAPGVMGRVPFYRARPETAVFAEHRIRGVARLGRWFVSRDPGVWRDAAWGVVQSLARRIGLKGKWTEDRPRPYAIAAAWESDDRAWLAQCEVGPHDLVIADYAFQSEAFAFLGTPRERCAIVMHDLFHRRSGSGAGAERDSVAALTREAEVALLGRAGTVIAIQQEEADFVARALPRARVILAPGTREVEPAGPPAAPGQLLFVGSRTAPNTDGLAWFLERVWPQVREVAPTSRLDVVGTVAADFERARVPGGVTLHGLVPDLAPFYRRAGIVVSPLRFGSGLKIKLVEALAWGKPVVASPVTLQGVERECAPAVMVAEDAASFAAAILALQRDSELRDLLTRRARAVVEAHFARAGAHGSLRAWAQDAAKGRAGAGMLLPPEMRAEISCFQ